MGRTQPRPRRALLLPDKKGWIFDFLCSYEADALRSHGWEVSVAYQSEPDTIPRRGDAFDIVFNPSYAPQDFDRRFFGKLVRGVFGHKWAWSPSPKRTLDRALWGVRAVVVPNAELLSMIKWYFPMTFHVTEGTDPAIFTLDKFSLEEPFSAAWTGDPRHRWKGLADIVVPACRLANVPLRIATNLSRHELSRLYNSVDVVLVATQNEGSPNCVFEAGACGRPIVGTRAGVIPEAIVDGRNGLIVDRNVEAFAAALRWCKANREKVRAMGLAHRTVVLERYTVHRHANQICELFEALVHNRVMSRPRGALAKLTSQASSALRRWSRGRTH